jgi:outer membrane protein OmpA-like peptidoglycan-associated protein
MTTRIIFCFCLAVFCSTSIEALCQPISSSTKIRLPDEFSAHQPTILPVLTNNGKRLYFDRKNFAGNIGATNDFDDIWFADLLPNGSWSKAQSVGRPLDTEGSDVLCSLSPDDRTALVYGIYDKELPVKNEGFSLTHFKNGEWQFPQPIQIRNFYNRTKKYYARLAPDNRTLLLALQRNDALGGLDLYVSFREGVSLQWSEPRHLGATLNTSAAEGSPHLAPDGKTLYFSSEGLAGSGVADLFVTQRLDDSWQRWSTPVNLGSGINTGEEDSSIDVTLDGISAYFLSSDADGKKGLFKATLPDSMRHSGAVLLHGRTKLDKSWEKALKSGQSHAFLPKSEAKVLLTAHGMMRDSAANARPTLFSLTETTLGEIDEYALALPAQGVYVLRASIDSAEAIPDWIGVVDTRGNFQGNERLERREQHIVFGLQTASHLDFPPIRFAQEQATIAPEHAQTLTMIAYAYTLRQAQIAAPGASQRVVVEITGHTCDLGTNEENDMLAQERAEAVATLLESQGVPHGAITVRSEGERKPLSRSQFDEARALNRRVEVRVMVQGQAQKRAQR